ncbi:uncharacterized protein MELLADRAFT_67556 [Melampsora larici-populina 98AG31]|uniref:Uncharacterized protein n=1 Tax=Melampsora larici-populina (strain 98AG31 / pathotype 3-4-7) TaxID=747676 RepID=F4S3K5_MELLP|nr:uncharacterized protein MELLADRAFT_67556 [Melampsora larici-populina 98AG31]EGG00776.1 hypothetical protein MELLADRAFT_67556 [Melampsora larici-populina 98AG31]
MSQQSIQQSMASLLHGRTLRPRGPTPGPSIVTTQEITQESNNTLEKIDEIQVDGGVDTQIQTMDQLNEKEISVKEKKGKGKGTKQNTKNSKTQKEEAKPTGIELEAQGREDPQRRGVLMNESDVQVNEQINECQQNENGSNEVGNMTVGFGKLNSLLFLISSYSPSLSPPSNPKNYLCKNEESGKAATL